MFMHEINVQVCVNNVLFYLFHLNQWLFLCIGIGVAWSLVRKKVCYLRLSFFTDSVVTVVYILWMWIAINVLLVSETKCCISLRLTHRLLLINPDVVDLHGIVVPLRVPVSKVIVELLHGCHVRVAIRSRLLEVRHASTVVGAVRNESTCATDGNVQNEMKLNTADIQTIILSRLEIVLRVYWK